MQGGASLLAQVELAMGTNRKSRDRSTVVIAAVCAVAAFTALEVLSRFNAGLSALIGLVCAISFFVLITKWKQG